LFLSGNFFKGVSMNEINEPLGAGVVGCFSGGKDQSFAIQREKRSVETDASLSVHRTSHPGGSSVETCISQRFKQREMFDLGPSTPQSEDQAGIESKTGGCQRNLGVCDADENVWRTPPNVVNLEGIVLRPSQVKTLVNQAGLGSVLNERQLLRYRKESPEMETADGGVHLVRFIAALCQRRTKCRLPAKQTKMRLPELYELLEEQDYRCALTGKELSPDDVALDHIVPISNGGDFSIANSQLVSKAANRAKHTLSQDDFIELCKSVAATQKVLNESEP
jgi:5-methylcytosine-specific restriction endonuclease McrA